MYVASQVVEYVKIWVDQVRMINFCYKVGPPLPHEHMSETNSALYTALRKFSDKAVFHWLILHVLCFGIHIASLYGPMILIFSSIRQQYIENIHRRFSENRIYFNTRNIEIEKSSKCGIVHYYGGGGYYGQLTHEASVFVMGRGVTLIRE